MPCCIARKVKKARCIFGGHGSCREEESRSFHQWRNAACRLSWSVVLLCCLCHALNGAKVAALDTDPCQQWSTESNALPSGDHVLATDGALYIPYKRLKVSLTGPFNRLLMHAKIVGGSPNNSWGMFTDLPDFAWTQSCRNPHDTILVDGKTSNLDSISVTWIAPGLSAGEVEIVAQIKTKESDTWLLVRSAVIYDNVSLYEDHMGTAFSFMLMDIDGERYQPEAYITTLSESSIPVNIVTGSQSHHSSLLASKDRPGFDRLSTRARLRSSALEKKALLVSANKDLGVVIVNKEQYSLDGFLALPDDALGTEYFAVSYTPSAGQHSQLGVCPTQNSTLVSVALPPGRNISVWFRDRIYNGGEIITVELHVLEALQIQSGNDLTGTRVYSNKPVAVFSGNEHGSVRSLNVNPTDKLSTDHMVEQLLPVKSWGRTFVVIPFPERPNGNILRIVASEMSTVVTVSDNRTVLLPRAGDYKDIEIISDFHYWVESNKPVQVVQFSKSHVPAGNVADAAMSLVPSIEQHSNHYWFITPDGSRGFFETNYVMIAVEEPYKDEIYIEGISFEKDRISDLGMWTSVSGSKPMMVATTIKMKMEVYHVYHENNDVMFQLVLTGHTENECYAMPMGLRLYHTNEKKCVPRPQEGVDTVDNDCDGHVDEERCDGQDDDGDGYIDEDCFYSSEGTSTDHGVTGDVTGDSYNAESNEDQAMFSFEELCGMAAGGILLIFLLILVVIILCMRKRRQHRKDQAATNDTAMEEVSSNAPSSVIASVSSIVDGRNTSLGHAPSVTSSGYQSEALAEEEEEVFETIY